MTTQTQTYVAGNSFWTLRFNLDSKHVRTVGGRIGTLGYTRRLHFPTREDVREYIDGRLDAKLAKGFVQVA